MNQADGNHDRKRLRVLVADDSAAIRDSLSSLISRLSDVEIVGLARTGLEAYELIQSLNPDVVTLDIRMPGMSGIQVLEAIKKQQLEVTVIVLTGLAEMEYRRKCTDLGAKFFFHKSTEFEKLIEVLSDYRDRLNLQQAQIQGSI
ncbi:response regulator transcription factor [Pedosphaera parvula]|uniref:Response regulator receiver protein n=1 Tax=Pedosphaera parvula (strain Ellin514) TaxID=320771 RepID=B9XSJ5_PEDPL|nr:response regulator [Pedosphaera parvula]EEF57195.1 response regulator receiver protein [Pedosphaera parvula Ellin514]